ncbi:MAG: hypothetical protein JO246_03680 [Frankiaceae bacterium]|nr:hypothetical protein [Frankiaceae bacterium]
MSSVATQTTTTARPRLRDVLAGPRDSGLDLRNTWQIVAGAVLVPLGFAAIILGWAGAAHGRVDQQQIPYIISGGLLGLAGVIIGGFFFWAHWLYRIYDQADLHHQGVLREQQEFNRAVLQALGQGGLPVAAAAAGEAAGAAAAGEFVATPSGTNYHLRECPIVANHGSLKTVTAAKLKNMKPCRICEPGS